MLQGMNKKALALLGLGHLMVDLNTGALPALLPYLKNTFVLSYTMTSMLVLVANVSSSLVQPVFGYLSDRSTKAWLLPFGVIVATCGMASVGLVNTYPMLLLLVMISGIGIASYHPEAYKTAYLSTGEKKATGISLFSVGGNIGLGLGPLAVVLCLASLGPRGLLLLWIPGLVVGTLFIRSLPWLSQVRPQPTGMQAAAPAIPHAAMAVVLGVVMLGSCVHAGLFTYVPLYFDARGEDTLVVGSIVSLFLIAGAVGTLIAGPLSDRIGHKRFLVLSFGALCPLMLSFLHTNGLLSLIILALVGMCLSPMFAVTLVIAQSLMQGRLGTTAGLMTGVGFGVGGLSVMGLGVVADTWGIEMTMQVISVLPLLPWLCIFLLPGDARTTPQDILHAADGTRLSAQQAVHET